MFPPYEEISKRIINNPALAMNVKLEDYDDANILYRKSLTIPNVTIGVGVRRIVESDDNVLVAGVSFPLQLFDDNSIHVEKSYIDKKIRFQIQEQKKLELLQELYLHYSKANENKLILSALGNKLIPQADEALKIFVEGYKSGRYTLIDVLDSQNKITELEVDFSKASSEYYSNIFDMEKLIGQSISELTREMNDNE